MLFVVSIGYRRHFYVILIRLSSLCFVMSIGYRLTLGVFRGIDHTYPDKEKCYNHDDVFLVFMVLTY